MSCAVALSPFGQKDHIFSICCNTGNFLLDFLKVTITANLLASFADGETSRDSTYDVTPGAGAYWSNRKKQPVFHIINKHTLHTAPI